MKIQALIFSLLLTFSSGFAKPIKLTEIFGQESVEITFPQKPNIHTDDNSSPFNHLRCYQNRATRKIQRFELHVSTHSRQEQEKTLNTYLNKEINDPYKKIEQLTYIEKPDDYEWSFLLTENNLPPIYVRCRLILTDHNLYFIQAHTLERYRNKKTKRHIDKLFSSFKTQRINC